MLCAQSVRNLDDELARIVRDGTLVVVHDSHLLPLAAIAKLKWAHINDMDWNDDCTLGLQLHRQVTPFNREGDPVFATHDRGHYGQALTRESLSRIVNTHKKGSADGTARVR
jgi:hypothetical protein